MLRVSKKYHVPCKSSLNLLQLLTMSSIDQFESIFKSASKELFTLAAPQLTNILIISDGEGEEFDKFTHAVQSFLSVLQNCSFTHICGNEFSTLEELFGKIEVIKPDLIVTHRHLHSSAWSYPYSLGEYVDILTQATAIPILLVPHYRRADLSSTLTELKKVMAITGSLVGDNSLVNYSLAFASSKGQIVLSHVEDKQNFDYYLEIISMIPEIETSVAKIFIEKQLLKVPTTYIGSCKQAIEENSDIEVISDVVMGSHLEMYKDLVMKYQTDLLVMNTKDQDQLAMHGMAYPLTIELRDLPLLLL